MSGVETLDFELECTREGLLCGTGFTEIQNFILFLLVKLYYECLGKTLTYAISDTSLYVAWTFLYLRRFTNYCVYFLNKINQSNDICQVECRVENREKREVHSWILGHNTAFIKHSLRIMSAFKESCML